jgi:hypothetical protein
MGFNGSIGFSYASIGIAAPLLLMHAALVRGVGLGGEWGGAVLLAIEKLRLISVPGGMFPQLGAQ